MPSNWTELVGTWKYNGGNAPATVTVDVSGIVTQIVAVALVAAGSVVIFGGQTISLPVGVVWTAQFFHSNVQSKTGNQNIVFGTNVVSYFVEWIVPR